MTLAGQHPDHRIANRLNEQGLRTQTGKPWTYDRVASMRRVHGIPTGCPIDTTNRQDRSDGFVPAAVAARCLGQSLAAIRVWAHDGGHRQINELKARRLPGSPGQKLTATPVTSAQPVKACERASRRSAALQLAKRRKRFAT